MTTIILSREKTRQKMVAIRRKYGYTSAIGYRCSNIIKLTMEPILPMALIERQMADLQRLLRQPVVDEASTET